MVEPHLKGHQEFARKDATGKGTGTQREVREPCGR